MRGPRLKNLVQILLLLSFTTAASAGVEGPVSAKTGEFVKIKFPETGELLDIKIKCYPANTHWEGVRQYNNDILITFLPREAGEYTFVLAGNRGNKTALLDHKIVVTPAAAGDPGPMGRKGEQLPADVTPKVDARPPATQLPADPGPSPRKELPVSPPLGQLAQDCGKYTAALRITYTTPNPTDLGLLINLYDKVATRTPAIADYNQLRDILNASSTEILGSETKLRGVRDTVDRIFAVTTPYDPNVASSTLKEIARSLRPLQGG